MLLFFFLRTPCIFVTHLPPTFCQKRKEKKAGTESQRFLTYAKQPLLEHSVLKIMGYLLDISEQETVKYQRCLTQNICPFEAKNVLQYNRYSHMTIYRRRRRRQVL